MTLERVEAAVQQTVQDALTNLAEIAGTHELGFDIPFEAEWAIRNGVKQLFYDQLKFRAKKDAAIEAFAAQWGEGLKR